MLSINCWARRGWCSGLVLALVLAPAPLGEAQVRGEPSLEVVASILPLADFTARIGGPHVSVTTLVRPGQNPHAFTLKPSQVAALHRARLLVLNGLGLEFWADTVVASLDTSRVRVLRAGEGLAPEATPAPDEGDAVHEEDGHGHGPVDPHVWLDPVLAMEMVARIRDALAEAAPAHAAEFRERAARYLADLAALHRDYEQALRPLPQRTFIAFHAGYGHLAARYGLREVAILRGIGDAEPSPARIAEIIRTARLVRARAIFAEPQYPARAARLIAEEAGAGLAILDGLGQREDITYLELMRENLRQLVAALR
jgi:zinc transport system substrate-binding protein